MGLEFTTAVRRAEPLTFTLDEREYDFTPPKSAAMILPVLDAVDDTTGMAEVRAMKGLLDWLSAGLSEDDVSHLWARLKDPTDDLDVGFLTTVARGLSEEVAGRPTT